MYVHCYERLLRRAPASLRSKCHFKWNMKGRSSRACDTLRHTVRTTREFLWDAYRFRETLSRPTMEMEPFETPGVTGARVPSNEPRAVFDRSMEPPDTSYLCLKTLLMKVSNVLRCREIGHAHEHAHDSRGLGASPSASIGDWQWMERAPDAAHFGHHCSTRTITGVITTPHRNIFESDTAVVEKANWGVGISCITIPSRSIPVANIRTVGSGVALAKAAGRHSVDISCSIQPECGLQ